MQTYQCKQCGDEWQFCPEDFERDGADFPTRCPHCEMPVTQMIADIYEEEGVYAVLKQLIKRYL